jgi:hypothetical protein
MFLTNNTTANYNAEQGAPPGIKKRRFFVALLFTAGELGRYLPIKAYASV